MAVGSNNIAAYTVSGAQGGLTDMSGFADLDPNSAPAVAPCTLQNVTSASASGRALDYITVAAGDSKVVSYGEHGLTVRGDPPTGYQMPLLIIPDVANVALDVTVCGRVWDV